MDILKAHGKKILLLVAAFGLAALTLAIWLNDIPDRDSVHRYIPMTEAFVHGDYAFAFHPRIPPLHQICGGIVSKLLGVNVFLGLRITSAIWHFIGAALLCRLLFVLYPARRMVAVAGTALYMFFPYMFHLAYSGLRETAKCALLILLALGLVHICRERTRWRWYLLLGGAAGLGALCRAEMTAIGLFCLFMAAVMESESGKFPLRSAAGTVVALAFGFGNSLVNHHFFGHAMSDIRFARLFMDLTGRNAQPLDALVLSAAIMILLTAGAYWAERLLRRIPAGYLWGAVMLVALAVAVFTAFTGRRHGNPSEIGAFVISILEGIYYFVVPIALVYVGRQVFLHKFTREEHAVLIVAASNMLLCILQVQVFEHKLTIPSRYLHPATPLFLGFFLLGWETLYHWFHLIFPHWFVKIMLAASIFGLAFMYVYHVPQPLYREYTDRSKLAERAAIREFKRIIATDRRPLVPRKVCISPWRYQSRKRPWIWFYRKSKISVAAWLVGGSRIWSVRHADYVVAESLPRCIRAKSAILLGKFRERRRTVGVWRIL